MVSRRTHRTMIADNAPFVPTIGLRLSVHECFEVTWIGIREILSRNAKVLTKVQAVELQQLAEQSARYPKIATDVSTFPSSSTEQLTSSRRASSCAHKIPEGSYPTEIIAIYIGLNRYQPIVHEHTNRVLRGEFSAAQRLEYKWAESIIAQESVGAGSVGSWRRRRRARKAQKIYAEEEGRIAEYGVRASSRWSAQSGSCALM